MRILAVIPVVLALVLAGCGSESLSEEAQPPRLTFADLPEVDAIYEGDYDAWLNKMPPVHELGPPVHFTLGEFSDLTITDAWFVDEDENVRDAAIDSSRGYPFVGAVHTDGKAGHPVTIMKRIERPNASDRYIVDVVFEATTADGQTAVYRVPDAQFGVDE